MATITTPLDPSKSSPPYTLITGCTPGGIGPALALTLSSPPYNHHVLATARTPTALASLASNPNITPLELDVTSESSIQALLAAVTAVTGGRLDFLVNNAGRNYTAPGVEVDAAEVRATFDANFFGVVGMCCAFAPVLVATARARRGESGGRGARPAIVQIGSLAGVMPYVFGSVYNASKAALHSYSDAIRLELRPFGVDVVVVVTGGVRSNIAREERRLREGSLYRGIEGVYMDRQRHSQVVGMDAGEYARSVAAQMTGRGRRDRIWEGGLAWVVWFATTWCPRWVMEVYMTSKFGLRQVE